MKIKIIKLLQQTTSSNDNEALIAIRMANKMLATKKLHWEELFSTPVPSISKEQEMKYIKRIQELERELERTIRSHKTVELTKDIHIRRPHEEVTGVKEKIELCIDYMPYNPFLHSINDFFQQNGFLTFKQLTALDTIYENL